MPYGGTETGQTALRAAHRDSCGVMAWQTRIKSAGIWLLRTWMHPNCCSMRLGPAAQARQEESGSRSELFRTHGQAWQAGQAEHGEHIVGKAYGYIWNAILQLEIPFGHIWNVLTWCWSKPSWRSLFFIRIWFIVLWAFRSYGNISFVGGIRFFLNAKSCKSNVIVVPVRFALLEALILWSESICVAFWG